MITIDIPGWRKLEIHHLLCDLNGTLALDGILEEGVAERLRLLSKQVDISVLTADTHGTAASLDAELPLRINRMSAREVQEAGGEAQLKQIAVLNLGKEQTVFMGNGANDVLALDSAALGIAVAGREGLYRAALEKADLVVPNPVDALDLLLIPQRIIAGLRR